MVLITSPSSTDQLILTRKFLLLHTAYLDPELVSLLFHQRFIKPLEGAISACHTVRSTYKECRSDRLNVPVK